jgi:hypothetical protein
MRNLSSLIVLSILAFISGCASEMQSKDGQALSDTTSHTIAVVPYNKPTAVEKRLSNQLTSTAVEDVAHHVANWQLAFFFIRKREG